MLVCLFVCLFVCLVVWLFVCLFGCLFVCVRVHARACVDVCASQNSKSRIFNRYTFRQKIHNHKKHQCKTKEKRKVNRLEFVLAVNTLPLVFRPNRVIHIGLLHVHFRPCQGIMGSITLLLLIGGKGELMLFQHFNGLHLLVLSLGCF